MKTDIRMGKQGRLIIILTDHRIMFHLRGMTVSTGLMRYRKSLPNKAAGYFQK